MLPSPCFQPAHPTLTQYNLANAKATRRQIQIQSRSIKSPGTPPTKLFQGPTAYNFILQVLMISGTGSQTVVNVCTIQ